MLPPDLTVPPSDEVWLRRRCSLDLCMIVGQKGLMDRLRHFRILTIFVIAFYALAMAGMGFAHQALPVAPSSPDLSALVLPDGSLPDLCAEGASPSDPSGPPQGAGAGVCDACLLTAAPGAVPSDACWAPFGQAATQPVFSPPSGHLFTHAPRHVAHLRGPPATL